MQYVVIIIMTESTSMQAVKKKFRSCRVAYTAYLQKKKSVTGGVKLPRSQWFAHAAFLEPHIVIKDPFENLVSEYMNYISICTSRIVLNSP
jgi:hypothetical protein